ncbi:VOC family protein [Streptomyces sp. SID3212]|uniref:VOC family protein n=1 Tax=Streptomyces sp. SID3212 TaxID=2690259 RepID=UPI00136FCAB5|nr:VOC family protein [Streptomyces sp. SID3212]MYV54184.1 VOC family protein [Streptomyces sp. SID3212]
MSDAPVRATPGTPCWVNLMVHDVPGAEAFYGPLFGWEFAQGPPELGLYMRGRIGDHEIAGIGQLQPNPMLHVCWTTYLATDDADATASAIRTNGGTVAVPPLAAGLAGRLTIALDPAGALFGTWEPGTHPGTMLTGPHGTPVWCELITPETASIGAFYRGLFAYDERADGDGAGGDGPGPDVQTLALAGTPVASLHGIGSGRFRERHPYWIVYFEVDDTDAAALLVTERGGQVLRAPEDGAHGRTAIVTDPEGALFGIVRSPDRTVRSPEGGAPGSPGGDGQDVR